VKRSDDDLEKGQRMQMGECLKKGDTRACLQSDGNLLVKKQNKGTLDAKWKKIVGSGTDIDADSRGVALIRTKHGKMFKYIDQRWEAIYGCAQDVAVGGEGTMWHIGCDKKSDGNFGIYRMKPGQNKWKKIPGAGKRISADGSGNALVVNK